jgi:hypothetical protein
MLRVADAFAIVGVVLVAIALTLVVYLITDMVYDTTAAAVGGGCLAGAFVIAWFVVPIAYRRRRTPAPPPEERQDGSPTA